MADWQNETNLTPQMPGGDMVDLERTVADLRAENERLKARIQELEATRDPVNGPTRFAEWVDWLSEIYYLPGLREQVNKNSAIVAELTALHFAYQSTSDPKAPGNARAQWHDTLQRTVARLRIHEENRAQAEQLLPPKPFNDLRPI